MISEEAIPQAADLATYRNVYSKPLPTFFVGAVTDLVKAGPGGMIKLAGVGTAA